MKRIIKFTLLTTLLIPMFAIGETGNTKKEEVKIIQEEDRVVYKKETALDFSDAVLSGELLKPNAAYVKNRRKTKFPTLIEQRSNFRSEMMETLDNL